MKNADYNVKENLVYVNLISLLLAGFLLFFFPKELKAYVIERVNVEEVGDFVMEPGRFEVILSPGEEVVRYISITNRVNQRIEFAIELEDFKGSDDPADTRALILLGDERGPYSLRDYLHPSIEGFGLEFGEKITFPVMIRVPEDAEPGGLYGSVLISNRPTKEQEIEGEGARAIAVSRLGALFLVRVEGESVEQGRLEDFRIVGGLNKSLFQSAPREFEILFRNQGNVHLAPYGWIDITNIWGQEMGFVPIDAYFVLPESLRYRQVAWENSPDLMLGRYKAQLTLHRGYDDIVEYSAITFWVLPWKTIALGFLVIVLIIGLLYYITTRFEFRRKK